MSAHRKLAVSALIFVVFLCVARAVATPLDDFASGISSAGESLGEVFLNLAALVFMISVVTLILDGYLIYTGWRLGGYEIGDKVKRVLLGIGGIAVITLLFYSIGDYVSDLKWMSDIARAIVNRAISFLPTKGG